MLVAISRCRVLRTAWPAVAFLLVAPLLYAGERRGGIEIGAKGVKATVVEISDAAGSPAAKTIMTEVSNTTVVAGVAPGGLYSAEAIRDTAVEAGKFAQKIRDEFQVPPQNLRVVGSSGLPQASNRDELAKAVREATGAYEPMEFLTPCREVQLTILGLIPEAERNRALLVDVGSGSTKGGFLGSDGHPTCFSVPLGSVTYANRVKKDLSGKSFPEKASELRPTLLAAPLDEQVRAQPELATRTLVLLSGGAPYALATLMHPESTLKDRVTLSSKDIVDYAQLVRKRGGGLKPDLTSIVDPTVRAAAEREVKNVLDTFTRENLISGAEVLLALADTMKFDGKTLVFDRTGITAWIRASLTAPPFEKRKSQPVYPSPQSIPPDVGT